jgi:hypothetical protein
MGKDPVGELMREALRSKLLASGSGAHRMR